MKIAIVKGDLRQNYVWAYLEQLGMDVSWIEKDQDMKNWDALILPVRPDDRSRQYAKDMKAGSYVFGGGLEPEWMQELLEKRIICMDYLRTPQAARINNLATAEGVLSKLLQEVRLLLAEMRILLIGYGNCGRTIVELLNLFGTKILVVDKSEEARGLASAWGYETVEEIQKVSGSFDAVINTVPELVMDQEALKRIRSRYLMIDLASDLGGFDYRYCEKEGILVAHMLKIPSHQAPESCGRAYGEVIALILKERDSELE